MIVLRDIEALIDNHIAVLKFIDSLGLYKGDIAKTCQDTEDRLFAMMDGILKRFDANIEEIAVRSGLKDSSLETILAAGAAKKADYEKDQLS